MALPALRQYLIYRNNEKLIKTAEFIKKKGDLVREYERNKQIQQMNFKRQAKEHKENLPISV